MPVNPLQQAQKLLKNASLFAGGAAALIPGASYFTDRAPPYFESSALLTTGVAAGVLLLVVLGRGAPARDRRRSVQALIVAVMLTVLYTIGTKYWTVGPPTGFEGARLQTGFHLAEWSLTPSALEYVRKHPNASANELMLAFGGYGDGHPVHRIWQTWSIVIAGLALCVTFAGTFVLWASGFALLARSLTTPRQRK